MTKLVYTPTLTRVDGSALALTDLATITWVVDGVQQAPVLVGTELDLSTITATGDHTANCYDTDTDGRQSDLCAAPYTWNIAPPVVVVANPSPGTISAAAG